MTITPRWNQDKSANAQKEQQDQPSAVPAQNLSDLDVTQPSLRVAGGEGVGATQSSKSAARPYATSSDKENSGATAESRTNEHKDALIGTIFADRYEVVELLGRGGMGSVYKARNRINKNYRALKLMHAHLVADPQVFRRFQQEATAAARITHPNAITIIDMGMASDGRPYLVMDFLDGMSLSELLKYKKKLPIREALHIFLQMCGALAEAHSHGVIHRDIKPSNVMLLDGENSNEYFVKVVDFGIAKVFPQEGDPTMKDTTTGELFGSPPYMSPEQCLGKRLDYRSDIYSMGCLMYEVLTGAPPLVGENALGTMYRQINEMPHPLSDIKDDVRLIERLDAIITRTLEKSPDNRYQTIVELHKDLESAGELSAKKFKALSALTLKFQSIKRALSNMMGSSKKAVVIALIVCLLFMISGSVIVAPYLLTKDPSGLDRVVAWQTGRPEDKGDSPAGLTVHIREMEYVHGRNSEDTMEAISALATFYYTHDKFDSAFSHFEAACMIGRNLLRNKFATCKNPESALHTFATNQLLRFLALRQLPSSTIRDAMLKEEPTGKFLIVLQNAGLSLGDIPFVLSKSTLSYLANVHPVPGDDEAYLNALIGLVYAREATEKGSTALKLADQSFETVLSIWKKSPTPSAKSRILPALLSEIGDFYLNSNDPKMLANAGLAFALARDAWKNSGATGLNNIAVTDERMGQVQQRLGHHKDAAKLFKDASDEFYAAAKTDTLDKAKALFDEADASWASGDYLGSMNVHNQATKIWSATRNNH